MQFKSRIKNLISLRDLKESENAYSNLNAITPIPSSLPEQEKLLNEIWSIYSKHMDRYGETKQTKALRERYFDVLKVYRKNKKWQRLLKSS